ncbi:hypothetical protein KJS94_13730 [Flavihumibacter rivuli]|uniref:hypothetical protein n=1 Tax=Flavihumibacter rivuli TaxID=2838156 RepID=UPI001BDEB975|nr:hypothetical protein [Flavihumibacter rivuli]ULQ55705.1 hypothetical protein KJS94_13730 [Flavihumibacter rivuli]
MSLYLVVKKVLVNPTEQLSNISPSPSSREVIERLSIPETNNTIAVILPGEELNELLGLDGRPHQGIHAYIGIEKLANGQTIAKLFTVACTTSDSEKKIEPIVSIKGVNF